MNQGNGGVQKVRGSPYSSLLIDFSRDLIHKSPSDRVKHATIHGLLDGTMYCTLHMYLDSSVALFLTSPHEEQARKLMREAEVFCDYSKSVVHTIYLLLTVFTEL